MQKPGDRLTCVVKANVRLQTRRLTQSPPIFWAVSISQAVRVGHLKVVGADYDLATGAVGILVD
ncbi:hypothetical protein HNI00_00990 [Thermoleptolyngbya oregonensis NK1-22]|uniref:Uncharacterized protein n=1 Tax=Thermoleptolyngbya oregonensis NK1-22 TaxID=2547457 RepID=A0AA97BKG3_9CYAN|nr:hypothetical protein [Thermoleptolyngbya oregonensis]WOB41907.1 hypothetical protein HNI00_00990 [Thermoleptolyngbya oregonensis NK1-22]